MTPAAIHHAPELDRVRANTAPEINAQLDLESQNRVRDAAAQPDALPIRLAELDHEWDVERVLEAEAAVTALLGLALAVTVDKRFLVLPGFAAAMVLLHALQAWYPLLPMFRRLGVRTQDEIDRERFALKSLRGDFAGVADAGDSQARADAAWRAVLA